MERAPIASIVGVAVERSRKRRVLQRGVLTGVHGSARGPRLYFKNGITVIRVNNEIAQLLLYPDENVGHGWSWVEYPYRAHFSRQDNGILEWGKFPVH